MPPRLPLLILVLAAPAVGAGLARVGTAASAHSGDARPGGNSGVRIDPHVQAHATRPAAAPPAVPAPADTILRTDLDRPTRAVLLGLTAAPEEPHVRLGMRRIRVGPGGVGVQRGPFGAPAPGAQAAPSAARLTVPTRFGSSEPATIRVEPLLDVALRERAARLGLAPDSARFLPPPPTRPATALEQDPDRFVTDYADLALNVRSRMELGGDWTRFQPCDEQLKVSCNPTLIPQLSPDVQFGVQVNGTIADRIQVDVDFDQAREFDAANRINIYYEGAEDDVLRRLEVGDVTFNLPRSRFLTEGIPAGNFGFQAEGQVGPLDFQTVWAQQRGDLNSRVFQLAGLGDQRAFVQEDTLVLDDADYVRGQFFFLMDPSLIDRYPHIDVLELDAAFAPPAASPGDQPIQLYRFEDEPVFQQQVEGFIQADAEATLDGVTVVESGWFRYLQEGLDYFVHPSGLWVALRAPLGREEMLAVTYITAAGDTVGDYNPERIHNAGGRPLLRLLKASGANHQPGRPTWETEMHQVYRVSGSPDVQSASVGLTISLGELSAGRTFKRRPSGEDITFLRLMGLDVEAPLDQIDPAFVYSPGTDPFGTGSFTTDFGVFQDQSAVQGTFVVFPTLRPFAEPPPLPSLGLSEVATAQILGDDANPRIYDEEDPFERDNAGRFRLSMAYRLRSEGLISSFSLGAFGIRDGSERIFLGDRLLTRGIDYEIDYDVGQVLLLEPELLFAAAPDPFIQATWEQRSLFQVSPTQVFGLRTHASLGEGGGVDLLGLYQSERTVVTRPILGTEPGAAFLGGLNGSYRREIAWMDRVFDAVPGLRFEGSTTLSVDGELALSAPNPNTRGRAFVDDFDAAAQLPISLLSSSWVLGSAPTFRDGAEAVLPPVLDASTAAPLVWQHTWVVESITGDSIGVHEGYFPRRDVDRQIRVAGSEVREPGLSVSLGASPSAASTAWRSVTTSLSTTGLDLTRTEFLEFYVAGDPNVTLVVDLGATSEDAFFVDSLGNTSGGGGGDPWGLGLLDQEADPRQGEIWNDPLDAQGVWGESCVAERGRIYRLGDPRAICTRGNGRPDTEDLDADGNLDVAERHLRYVVRLDGSSPFLERRSTETGTGFQLYRVPIEGAAGLQVGGALTDADLRAVRHMRITVAGPPQRRVEIVRMRLVGSRWTKRAGEGVLQGIIGDTLAVSGRVEVSSVSRVTEGETYTSPPGVLEELVDPTSAIAGQGIEFNEKSLGIRFEDVPAAGRAEVYHRFPQRPRNFLAYREARLWVVARAGDFGPGRPQRFFVKIGSDSENFYLYRTPLGAPTGASAVTQANWLPEVRIDFDRWFDLRRQAEETLSITPPAPGAPPVTVWSADSTYAVVLRDRGRAPNLAAVRELSMGIWNDGPAPASGEVWVDELRLGGPVRAPDVAGSVDIALDGAGVVRSRLSMTNRGAFFRQLRDDPTYQTDRTLDFTSSLALDRWMPTSWGLDMPVTLDLGRASQAPRFLAGSDVRADQLDELRDTESHQTRLGVAVRKRTPSANPWIGFVVDGLDARAGYTWAGGSTVTTRYDSDALDVGVGWLREPEAIEVDIVPAFAEGLVRTILPGFVEDDVADARLRLTPERVSVGTSYFRQDSRIFRFETIVRRDEDALTVPTLVPRETVQSAADVRMRPFGPLTADVALLTVRDLLRPDESVADRRVQALIREERSRPAGVDLGWETNRALRTNVAFRPSLVSWLRNDFDWTTVYQSDRNASFLERTPAGTDTLLSLARNARGQRDWRATVALDPGVLALAWLGEPTPVESPDVAQLRSMMSALQPLSMVYQDGITSRFNRDPVRPGLAYQLGWGDERSFRTIGGDTAVTATDRTSWTLGSGVSLPGGAGVQVGYQWAAATTLDTRSDRRTVQRVWPNVQARLPTISPPGFTGIQSVTLAAGIARTRRTLELGGRAQQERFDEDLRLPLDVSVTWLRNLVTSYQGALRTGRGEDPTGETERDEESHRVSLSGQVLPAGVLASALDRPVQLSLLAGYTSERRCRNTAARDECVTFLDQESRTVNLSLDTSVGGFQFGIQVSFDDRQSFVGQRTGSTQFQVGIFGQLELSAGALPVG